MSAEDEAKFREESHPGRVVQISISTTIRTETYPDEPPCSTDGFTVFRFRESRLEKLSHLVWAFDSAWDFFRIILSPKIPNTKITPCDPVNIPPLKLWAATQNVLLKEGDQSDTLSSLACFHSRQTPDTIVGLRATYRFGDSRDMGNVTGPQTRQSMKFSPGDKIHMIDLFRNDHGFLGIHVHTMNQDTGNKKSHKIVDNIPDRNTVFDADILNFCYRLDLSKRVHRIDSISVIGQNRPEQDLPSGKMIGIWGFEVPKGGLQLGLLFLQEHWVLNYQLL
ncbi:hypothetical protein BBP40_009306 [Aspergillus hancockii]|nr:hypothetical protein BBP40_009306 [Aspergillus hancockii]